MKLDCNIFNLIISPLGFCINFVREKEFILDKKNIIEIINEVIETEYKSIASLAQYIDNTYVHVVETIHSSKGRVVISGIGKSAIIAQKIVATFNSTGTPAVFMHAADAIHGDLGIIQKHDVVIIISKSGETPEIKVLVPLIKNFDNIIIAICGNKMSYLATQANYFLNATVKKEACPNNLAPTSSTTAQLVIGDALAVALLHLKGFEKTDFAKYHPGGALGKQLYLKVSDLCKYNDIPHVKYDATLNEVLLEISQKRLGATAVLNDNNILCGVITDGDIRRIMLEKNNSIQNITAKDIMNKEPKTISIDAMAVDALHSMRQYKITQLITLDAQLQYAGFVHLHDIIREGIV